MKTRLRLIREIRQAYKDGFIFGVDIDGNRITLHIDPSITHEVVERLRAYLLRAFPVDGIDHRASYSGQHNKTYSELVINTNP